MWDWGLNNNLNCVDPPAEKPFDPNRRTITEGLPLEDYIKPIHPGDMKPFQKLYVARDSSDPKNSREMPSEFLGNFQKFLGALLDIAEITAGGFLR